MRRIGIATLLVIAFAGVGYVSYHLGFHAATEAEAAFRAAEFGNDSNSDPSVHHSAY